MAERGRGPRFVRVGQRAFNLDHIVMVTVGGDDAAPYVEIRFDVGEAELREGGWFHPSWVLLTGDEAERFIAWWERAPYWQQV